jgi:hypothetical protein
MNIVLNREYKGFYRLSIAKRGFIKTIIIRFHRKCLLKMDHCNQNPRWFIWWVWVRVLQCFILFIQRSFICWVSCWKNSWEEMKTEGELLILNSTCEVLLKCIFEMSNGIKSTREGNWYRDETIMWTNTIICDRWAPEYSQCEGFDFILEVEVEVD